MAVDASVKKLNDLSYPYDYALEDDSVVPIRVTGTKYFDRLIVERLSKVSSINNVDIGEFVTLENDHVFTEDITFHNITILGTFTVITSVCLFRVN